MCTNRFGVTIKRKQRRSYGQPQVPRSGELVANDLLGPSLQRQVAPEPGQCLKWRRAAEGRKNKIRLAVGG